MAKCKWCGQPMKRDEWDKRVGFPIHPECLERFRDAEAALYEEE